jgi:hypothetical protein
MKPVLDRIQFQDGQRLDRDDLAQASRRTAGLLELHGSRGHNVWGVANGLGCSIDKETGAVRLAPGIALDALGRQLINPTTRAVPIPPLPDGRGAFVCDLLAHWADPGPRAAGGRPGFRVEQAQLRWVLAGPVPPADRPLPPLTGIRPGLDIPIARLLTDDSGSPLAVDTTARPVAHALTRPKIASGRVLQSSVPAEGTYANWTMYVSTASAGFQYSSSPVYLVSLDAHPFGETASLRDGSPNLATRMKWAGPLVCIESKDDAGFRLRVVTAVAPGWALEAEPHTNPVPVSWIGIDTPDPGPPQAWWTYLLRLTAGPVIIP